MGNTQSGSNDIGEQFLNLFSAPFQAVGEISSIMNDLLILVIIGIVVYIAVQGKELIEGRPAFGTIKTAAKVGVMA